MCIIKNYDKFLVKLDLLQQKAINFYRKNCQSIEIVKDDELQKVNFRVKNKVLLTNVTIVLRYFFVNEFSDILTGQMTDFLLELKKRYYRCVNLIPTSLNFKDAVK